MSLVYANVSLEDILLKKELDELAAKHPARFNVHYVLNNPPEKWDGGVGFVSTAIIKERLPAPAPDVKILLCGAFSRGRFCWDEGEGLGTDGDVCVGMWGVQVLPP